MPEIKGGPDVPAAYLYRSDDPTMTTTAIRATYRPSINNRITNMFARRDMPRAARMVNAVRDLDLSLRSKNQQRRQDVARTRFEQLQKTQEPDQLEHDLHGQRMERFDIVRKRIEVKRELGNKALAGTLQDGIDQANRTWRTNRMQEGYVELRGLQATPLESASSHYLVSTEDGHRIKINSERPPRLARMIASSTSAAYDRGSTGTSRAIRSAWQHALVGVYSMEQVAKFKIADGLRRSPLLDAGGKARMNARATRAADHYEQVQASLGGNVALNQSFQSVVQDQRSDVQARLDHNIGPRYEVRASLHGIKPAQTRSWERRVNAFFQPSVPPDRPGAGSEDIAGPVTAALNDTADAQPPAPERVKASRIARFAVGVTTLRARASLAAHSVMHGQAELGRLRATDASKAALREQQAGKHMAAMNKAAHLVVGRDAIVRGELLKSYRTEMKDLRDLASAPADDVHAATSWQHRTEAGQGEETDTQADPHSPSPANPRNET